MTPIKQRLAAAVLALAGVSGVLLSGVETNEGKSNDAYVDAIAKTKVVTICYGDTGNWKIGDYLSDAQCSDLLRKKLNTVYAPIVVKYVKVPLTQGEYDALVDFVYNLGEGNFRSSTLLKKLNAGDYEGAGREFNKWVYTNGKDCRIKASKCGGIVTRRAWQTQLFAS